MQRKFISSVEALGLSDADRDRRSAASQTRAMPTTPVLGGGAATRALLNTPLFIYGKRILQALATRDDGIMPIGELLAGLQRDVGAAFNITDALTAIRELQESGALTSDGTICTITTAGRTLAI